jgi:tetratricopeptide (TPR) repeat protein
MKKLLVVLVLVFSVAVGATAQQSAQPQIKDPAEYNAYMGAIQATDPNMKASALESFVQAYPNSVMKADALELLMRTYQQLGNVPKTTDTANRVLQADPNNVTALALLSYLDRLAAQQGGPDAAQKLNEAKQFGDRGLQALQTYKKPENMSDADFAKLKDQLAGIFDSSVGMADLQGNNLPDAEKYLSIAANANPQDFSIVYPAALSFLNNPKLANDQYLQGIWFIARATNLAPTPQYKQQIGEFGRRKYMKFHGGDDGWTDVVAAAAASPTPPSGWTVAPAPTPAEQAAKMVQSKPVSQMSFDEIQFVLTSGNQQAADQVWTGIKDKPLALGGGKVITASASTLTIAESYDDINATPPKADITLQMAGDMPAKLIPKEGSNIDFQGKPSTYTPNPFMMTLTEGALVKAKTATPATPTHHTTTHKPASQ